MYIYILCTPTELKTSTISRLRTERLFIMGSRRTPNPPHNCGCIITFFSAFRHFWKVSNVLAWILIIQFTIPTCAAVSYAFGMHGSWGKLRKYIQLKSLLANRCACTSTAAVYRTKYFEKKIFRFRSNVLSTCYLFKLFRCSVLSLFRMARSYKIKNPWIHKPYHDNVAIDLFIAN